MPNVGHKWTSDEDDAVVSMSWSSFKEVYPDITNDAYRHRRVKMLAERSAPVPQSQEDLQRAIANNIKLARTVIRLRHSIESDDELARAIPRIKASLQEQAMAGRVSGLSYGELRTLIYGEGQ